MAFVGTALLACGEAPEQAAEESEIAASSQGLFVVTQPVVDPSFFNFAPPWAYACGAPARRFAVLTSTSDCVRQAGRGGAWLATRRNASAAGTLCEFSWSPYTFVMPGAPVPQQKPAAPDHSVLPRIALDDDRLPFDGHPGIHALCAGQTVCAQDSSCPSATLASAPPSGPRVPVEGMGGCSACAFVQNSTAYVVLPSDWLEGPIGMRVAARDFVLQGTSQLAPSNDAQVTTSFTVPLAQALPGGTVADGTPVHIYRR